jgi:TRAP-type C4-dicarboxylate transport system substrate-binding protein
VGYLNVMNSRNPVLVPKDLQGLKVRIPPAATEIAIWKALGASTVSLNGPEIYSALQTHLVDGVVTALSALDTFKWYELTKYISITHHSFASQTIVANNDAMQALPKDLRDIVDRNVNASQVAERADMARLDESLEKSFQSRGLEVSRPDIAPFRAEIRKAKLYESWRAQFGAQNWALLEKFAGPLG